MTSTDFPIDPDLEAAINAAIEEKSFKLRRPPRTLKNFGVDLDEAVVLRVRKRLPHTKLAPLLRALLAQYLKQLEEGDKDAVHRL